MKPGIEDFIALLEKEFPEVPAGTLKPDTVLSEVIEMSSMNALILISLVKTEYEVALQARDLLQVKTVQDLFNIVTSRQ